MRTANSEPTGIIFDIKRYAVHDGPGIRTTVFFKGCPAKCWWCHNPESQSAQIELVEARHEIDGLAIMQQEEVGRIMSVSQVMDEIKKDQIFADESGGGVTFSGGEPLLQYEFLIALLESCKEHNIHTVLDTTGHAASADFKQTCALVDLYLYDIKLIDDGFHQMYTGVSNKQILNNFKYLLQENIPVILRYPLIPGYTDSLENLDQICSLIAASKGKPQRIDILPFHNLAKNKYYKFCTPDTFSNIIQPDKTHIEQIKEHFAKLDIEIQIGG